MRWRPHISIVCAVHDPGYGGDLPRRASIFLRNICYHAKAAGVSTEVIFVEWNRRENAQRWRDLLRLPEQQGNVCVRVIEVSSEHHDAIAPSNAPPFFQPIAKNVGLRRARGRFLLSTDPDVLFTPQVFQAFAKKLRRRAFYRIDRYDVAEDVNECANVPEQLAFCRQRIAGIHTDYASTEFPKIVSLDQPGEIDEWLAPLRLAYRRTLALPRFAHRHQERLTYPVDKFHTNASGCFILMHRDAWSAICGHPEFTTRGHSDSVTCWSAVSAGLRQVVLQPPCYMFHQPHARGETSAWPQTDWRPWYLEFQKACAKRRTLQISGPSWGLAGSDFPTWRSANGQWTLENPAAVQRAAAA